MDKIKKIIIGTNNSGKYEEICALLPKNIKKFSPKKFNVKTPKETGKTFKKNSHIKASYYSKKTNLVCLSDDSGLKIGVLNGRPGILSARWGGKNKNFNLAINKIYREIKKVKKKWKENISAEFVCSMTLYWPGGKSFTTKGIIKGKIAQYKRGKRGFGYDPIFVPKGYKKTFGEMRPKFKMSIDHRFKAFKKLKKFFI
tara:strand:- start:3819 stop:4415 length:597 start_codon:yes stop_codon:yes gene_type:complete